MPVRTHTPDVVTVNKDGVETTTMHLKRCCNGCGTQLGDLADWDVDDDGNLTDVRAECGNCRPLTDAEAAGCRTWQLTRRSISDADFAQWRQYATPAWRTGGDGQRGVVGLEFTAAGHEPVTAAWNDWIIHHPDGTFTVHKAPEAGA